MVKTMRQNTQPEKQSLTPMQKQAVLVCIVCALAALLTIGITLVLIHRGKEPAALDFVDYGVPWKMRIYAILP